MSETNGNNTAGLEDKDVLSPLPTPTPMSEDADPIGEVSSSSGAEDDSSANEGTAEDEEEDAAGKVPIEERAYLMQNEAMKEMLGKEPAGDILSRWTSDDITGLLIQLTKHGHDVRGVGQITKYFRDTSPEEILECIEECKQLNRRASQERFRFQETLGKPKVDAPTKHEMFFHNWHTLALHAKKSRAIGDCTSNVLRKYLADCAADCPVQWCGPKDVPNKLPDYSEIYSHLSALAQGYAVRTIRSVDAAVILDIFEQMECDIEAMPDVSAFFKRMFRDVQRLTLDEFKLNEDVKEENAGELMMNPLDFPLDTSRLDFTKLLPSESHQK